MRTSLTLTLVLFALAAVDARGATLEAGFGTADITPPVGFRLSGYFHERLSTGTHDRLFAKAMVLRQGEVQAALVFCDIISVPAETAEPAKAAVAKRCGIPAAHVMIAATHSHTGPLYWGELRNYFHQRAVAAHGNDPQEKVEYPTLLADKIAEAVAAAQADAAPLQLQAGVLSQNNLAFNRRFHMKDGGVRFNPGKKNPNIVKVAGPTDPSLGVLLFRRDDGGVRAGLTVFALHLDTTGGTLYSADYPFYLEQGLRQVFGPQFLSLFGTGTCGDINHIDVSTEKPQPGGEEAQRIGETLARTIISKLSQVRDVREPLLGVAFRQLDLPLQTYSAADLEWARAARPKIGTNQLSFIDQVKACTILSLASYPGKSRATLVQAFRLGGDVAIVALPGEVFVELGLAIKKASPFANTLIVELANDCPAYVPTQKAFVEGSYETVNSRLQPGSGERIVEAAIDALRELKSR